MSDTDPLPQNRYEVSGEYKDGKYLGLLTNYSVVWDKEKTARDVWQNFFDGNNLTLDGVTSNIEKSAADLTSFSILGPSEYDYRHLLHLGAGTKTGDMHTAGGFGEGSEIAALVILRDMGATKVVHESANWRLTFYLDEVKDYPVGDKPAQGLYAKVEEIDYQQGSRFKVEFPDASTAEIFQKSKDLFFHSENPDFQEPTFDSDFGGFKLHVGKKGNVYEAGQRRHFKRYGKETGVYNDVADVTVWTKQKVFDTDRDRGEVDQTAINNRIVRGVVAKMNNDQIRETILGNPDLWHKAEAFQTGNVLLQEMCHEYGYREKAEPIVFPDNYVAFDLGIIGFEEELKKAGYVICNVSMARVGMITGSERFLKMQESKKIEPSDAEKIRIEVLETFASEILGVRSPKIWLYNKEHEKSVLHGHYTPEFIWIAQEVMSGNFSDALETYLHEITHEASVQHDTKFAYTLDANMKTALGVFEKALKDPVFGVKLKQFIDKWDNTNKEKDK